MNSKIEFIFCHSIDTTGNDYYCNFKHEKLTSTSLQYLDIKDYCHKNQSMILKDLSRWYESFTATAQNLVSDWWFTHTSRIVPWNSNAYDSIVFAVSLFQIINSMPQLKKIYVLNASPELISYLTEVQKKLKITKPSVTRYLFYFTKYLRSSFGFLKRHLLNNKKNLFQPRPILFFSQVLNSDNLLKGNDHYYGDIFQKFSENEKKQVGFLYHSADLSHDLQGRLKNKFNEMGFSLNLTSDFFTSTDLIQSMVISLRHFFQILKLAKYPVPITLLGHTSTLFYKEFCEKVLLTNQTIFIELEVNAALRKIKKLDVLKRLIYPYEERSIEKALLLASKDVMTLGFVHAVVHPGYLCYNSRITSDIHPPKPKIVLTTGQAPTDWFIKNGFLSEQVVTIGSPRNKTPLKSHFSQKLNVLIMIGQPYELEMLCGIIESHPNIFDGYSVSVRKHPNISLSEQDRVISKLKRFIPHINDSNENLESQLIQHDVVLFSTSSGGIEAIARGLIGIYINLDKTFILNPLLQLGHQTIIPQINEGKELNSFLEHVSTLSGHELLNLWQQQQALIEKIYAKPDFKRIFDIKART